MYCKKCGAQLADNEKFCKSCGEAVTRPEPAQAPIQHQVKKQGKKPGKALIIALATVVIVAAGGFGIWKYVQSHRILLLVKTTEYNEENGKAYSETYKPESIKKKSNGEIEVIGESTIKLDSGEIYHRKHTEIYRKDHTLKTAEILRVEEDFKVVMTYNELGNAVKMESISSGDNYTVVYDDYGIMKKSYYIEGEELYDYEIKYSGEDSEGHPTKATVLDGTGDVYKECELENGKVIIEKTDDGSDERIYEYEYDEEGNLLKTTYYYNGELEYKQIYEYEVHKIK